MGSTSVFPKQKFTLLLMLISLWGCGGGGENNTNTPSNNDNNSTNSVSGYTGLRTEANLDSQLAREAANDYIFIRNFIQSMLFSGLYSRDGFSIQSDINVSENCSGGGVVHLSTTSNVNNTNGVSKVAFDNCVDDNQTMHGDIVFTMNYTADTLNVRWNNLRFQEGNNQLLMKGFFDYKLRTNNMNISLLASDSDNRQLLVDSLRVPLPQDRINPEITDYSGDFYYSDKGHIKVNSESPLGSSQQNGYPSGGGPLVITDTSGSKATIIAEGNHVIFNYLPSETSGNPLFGRLPWDKLESEPSASGVKPVARELSSGPGSSITFRRFFSEAENIKLDGSTSSGSDVALLSFEWKIIKAPENSTATISQSNTVTPVFHPDYLGEYHIEQTVFDGFLKSDPKLIKIFLGTDTSVYLGSTYIEITQPGGEVTSRVIGNDGVTGHEVFIHAFKDSDSLPDFLKFNLKWELIEKPENSNFSLINDTLRDWSFTPDKAGDYVFSLTVNRGQEDHFAKVFLTVNEYQDVAFPRVIRITGHKVVNINQPVELEIEQYVSAGPPINSKILTVTKKPLNSTPQTAISGNDLTVTFDKAGRYDFSYVVSNGVEQSKPVHFIFYATDNTQPSNFEFLENTTIQINGDVHANIGMLSAKVNNDTKQDLIISWTNTNGLDDKYQIFYGNDSNSGYSASPVYDSPLGELELSSNTSNKQLLFNYAGGFNSINLSEDGVPLTTTINSIILEETLEETRPPQSYDLNNDGLTDKIWISSSWDEVRMISISNILSYSLQLDDHTFSTPTSIAGIGGIVKIFFEENTKSLLVLRSTLKTTYEAGRFFDEVNKFIEEYKLSVAGMTKINTYSLEINGTDYRSHSLPSGVFKAVDLDNDGVKELIGENYINSVKSDLVIWKKDSINNTYFISQEVIGNSRSERHFLVSDMDSDGDQDIIVFGHNRENEVSVLYQNAQGLFDTAELITTNLISHGIVRDFLISDHDNDSDSDIFIHLQEKEDIHIIRNKVH